MSVDAKLIKAKNNESGVTSAEITAEEANTLHLNPVPDNAPGEVVLELGQAKEEHIFYREKDAGAGTVSGLIRDYTNLNGGVGQQHDSGVGWETIQGAEYPNNLVDAVMRGSFEETQTIARVNDTSFTVKGNMTAYYTKNRVLRFNRDATKIAIVSADATYSAGTGLTTVVISGLVIPDPITYVELAIQPLGATDILTLFSLLPSVDQDDMADNSAVKVPTQQSVKAYVDSGTVTMTNKTLTSPTLQGNIDGWIGANETWTYATGNTFTVSGDVTGKYRKGDRVKLYNGSTKYFYIIAISYSAPNTTVTVTGGNQYSLANAAISANFYSRIENPIGFPAYFAHNAPTWDTGTIDNGTGGQQPQNGGCYMSIRGNECKFRVFLGTAFKNGIGAYIAFTLPTTTVPAIDTTIHSLYAALGTGWFYNSGNKGGISNINGGATVIRLTTSDNSNIADNTALSSTDVNITFYF